MSMIIDGTNGLTFNNATTQASGGKVIQVVSSTYSTQASTINGTFIDTGLTASITPLFSTSKILVLLNHNGIGKSPDNTANDLTLRLYRGATLIATPAVYSLYTNTALEQYGYCASLSLLDSPATTSSTTYKTQFNNSDGGGLVYVQRSGATSTITLLEIAV
jgi:hypothetical protein